MVILTLMIFIFLPALACNMPWAADEETIERTVNARLTEEAENAGEDSSNATRTPTEEGSSADNKTATITLSPTVTLTPTLENPMIHAKTDTNCRYGPSVAYDIIGYLLVGNEVPVLGRLQGGGWWYIQHPTNASGHCWVWATSTEIEGDTSKLPYITPPPTPTASPTNTPTPFAAFSASFANVHDCGGNKHITYQVGNTGNLAFESARIDFSDVSQGTSSWTQYNTISFFPTSSSCPGSGVENMGPGSVYFVMHGPATLTPLPGDVMQSTIKLCTENNLAGTCVSQTINYIYPAP